MALTLGENSYVDVATADEYLADRMDVAAWLSAGEVEKGQALVTATRVLDEQPWIGHVAVLDQPLAFPRIGSYFDPRLGYIVAYGPSIPKRVEVAAIELAYHLLNNDGLLDDTGSVDSLNIGSISLTKIQGANRLPNIVRTAIKPMLSTGGLRAGSNTWWRAN